jgi:hypothetical protein
MWLARGAVDLKRLKTTGLEARRRSCSFLNCDKTDKIHCHIEYGTRGSVVG